MGWEIDFQREVAPGLPCPCCTAGVRPTVTTVDYTAYSWYCSIDGRPYSTRHTSQNFINTKKAAIKNPEPQFYNYDYQDIYQEQLKVYKARYAPYTYNYPVTDGKFWIEEESKKEVVGSSNEFGEVCP
jgi:hypothetical protein